jgi:hypothetical protein
MYEFTEYAVLIYARLSALGEAEEAQSSMGGLLCRCVGAMTRYDESDVRHMLQR